MIKLDLSRIHPEATGSGTISIEETAMKANALLSGGHGSGNDFLGWVDLPSSIGKKDIDDITTTAAGLRELAEVIIVIGVGGSYLGSKAVIEALGDSFAYLGLKRGAPHIIYAGMNLSEDYMAELLRAVSGYSIAAIVISKSGTTTEPAIAFRIIRKEIESRYGLDGARERIVAVTGNDTGVLRSLAVAEGYKTYTIPDDIGGRFSVLTAVGLLPIAAAGIDIAALIDGARMAQAATAPGVPYAENPAARYAVARNILYRNGFKTEILGCYEPKLSGLAEWWKQLFGESEGKNGKGIFPAGVGYTADLHSVGQYIQDGERTLFETIVSVASARHEIVIESSPDNLDGLNFLAGKRLGEINRTAELGAAIAHTDGGVPNIRIEIGSLTPFNIGALLYFFEKACAISGHILGVNPFDQPGVETYKENMFALLGKPGYEATGERLREKLREKPSEKPGE